MTDRPRFCKSGGHDLNLVGTRRNGGCAACARAFDRKRAPKKRLTRKMGATPGEYFRPNERAYVFDLKRGFRWQEQFVMTSGRLRAWCEHDLRRNPDQTWAPLFEQALEDPDAYIKTLRQSGKWWYDEGETAIAIGNTLIDKYGLGVA